MLDSLVVVLSAYAASFVESVEALTIVLAVGLTRGWRPAIEGGAAALAVLALGAGAFGWLLLGRVPERGLKGVVGALILLFGTRWLRKAVLRAAGVIALHDEEVAYARTVGAIADDGTAGRDWRSIGVAFQGVLLEGLEVAFVVVAVGGSGGRLLLAAGGGIGAAACVAGLGLALRQPLARVPENLLKLGVGVMLTSLGTFWTIEAMGYTWPFDVASLLVVVALYAGVTGIATLALRGATPAAAPVAPPR